MRGSNASGGDAFDPEALHPRIGVKAARREAETSTPEVPPPKTGLLLVQTSLSEGSCARLALGHTSLSKDLRHCPTLGSHFTIQGPLPMSRIGSHLTIQRPLPWPSMRKYFDFQGPLPLHGIGLYFTPSLLQPRWASRYASVESYFNMALSRL